MRILNLAQKRDGGWYVRNNVPFTALEKLGHTVHDFYADNDKYDIAVFGRSIPQNVDFFIEKFKQDGTKIIYDTDDFMLNIEDRNPYSSMSGNQKVIDRIIPLLRHVDRVTCSVEPLKEELRGYYNGDIRVLPNCLDYEAWKKRENGKGLRVGWTGEISHPEDLLLVLPVIKELQQEYDFEFIIFGITSRPLVLDINENIKNRGEQWAKAYIKIAGLLEDINYVHIPNVEVIYYPEALSRLDFDIGLCPLVDSRFNRCKSPLKFFEYVAVGTVALTSHVTSYKEVCSFTAKNRHDKWKSKLKKLIESKEFCDDEYRRQEEKVKTIADISTKVGLWEDAYSFSDNTSS